MALALAACSPIVQSRGNYVDDGRLQQLTPGTTTQNDVAYILGSPSTVAPFREDEAWFYIGQVTEQRAFLNPQVVDRRVVAVSFDEAGFVTQVEELSLDDAEDVALVERETPTLGREMTVMEQLLGNLGRVAGGEQRQ